MKASIVKSILGAPYFVAHIRWDRYRAVSPLGGDVDATASVQGGNR
jgi:hypothetical protein